MKKIISAILAVTLVICLALTLTSCSEKLSGTYEGALFSLKFKGSKVSVVIDGESVLTGTYEIEKEDGKKTIEFDFVDEDDANEDEQYVLNIIAAITSGKLNFEKTENGIKIGSFLNLKKK
ncbi:MAG: hypothetical protein J6V09_01615 [Clostridia bacterium]|nr:hypothetical protein [Clostridia bacterium]